MFEQNHEKALSNAVQLLKYGADKKTITNIMFREKTLEQIKFLSLILRRLTTHKDIIYSYYDEKELKKYNIDDEQAGYAMSVIQNIQ